MSMPSPWMRPSPSPWRVGVRIEPFEACSGFTRVAAGRIAQPPTAAFVARLQPRQLPAQTARQLPDPSTLIRVGPSSTRETRPQGAHGDSAINWPSAHHAFVWFAKWNCGIICNLVHCHLNFDRNFVISRRHGYRTGEGEAARQIRRSCQISSKRNSAECTKPAITPSAIWPTSFPYQGRPSSELSTASLLPNSDP